MSNVEIQLQNIASKNWMTMKSVANQDWVIQTALDELKNRFPEQPVRAMCDGILVNMRP